MSRKYIRKLTYDIQQPEHSYKEYIPNELFSSKINSAKETHEPSVYKSQIDFSKYKGQNMKYSWEEFKKDNTKKSQSTLFNSIRDANPSTDDYDKIMQSSGSTLEQKKYKQPSSKVFTKPAIKYFQSKIHNSPLQLKGKKDFDVEKIRPKNFYLNKAIHSSNQNSSSAPNKVPEFVKNRNNDSPLKRKPAKISVDNFIILKDVAKGNFGEVFIVKQKKTNMVMAMKRVEKAFLVKNEFVNQFIRQLKIQSYLEHPNLIKLYYVFDDAKYIYLLMEYGCDGQLYKYISNEKQLSEPTISTIARLLLQAINYLHSKSILHRDLKPENIILAYGIVKICDFGWAVYSKQDLRSTFCGTPLYFSPQLIKNKKYNDKVDLWAIGIIAYQLKFFDSPFQIYDEQDIPKIVTKKIIFPESVPISSEYKQFLSLILEKDPNRRMGSQQLLNLPFIKKYRDLQFCQQLCK